MIGSGSLEEKIQSLIRWQCAKAGTSGFLTGLGGFVTLPIAIPANLASVAYVQLRMIAAIAHMVGLDIRNDRVKTLVYVCLVSSSTADVFKTFGKKFGERLAIQALEKVPGRVFIQINKQVGFRFVTKFGSKGMINVGKAIPLLGGVIGGGFDVVITRKVGRVASKALMDFA